MNALTNAASYFEGQDGQLVDAYLDWLAAEVRAGRPVPDYGSTAVDDVEQVIQDARRWWSSRDNGSFPGATP